MVIVNAKDAWHVGSNNTAFVLISYSVKNWMDFVQFGFNVYMQRRAAIRTQNFHLFGPGQERKKPLCLPGGPPDSFFALSPFAPSSLPFTWDIPSSGSCSCPLYRLQQCSRR